MGVLKYKSGNSWISVPTIRGERGIQGEQGIPGPTGSNGVYVGPTAPTDPDINVWVDTSGSTPAIPTSGSESGTNYDKHYIKFPDGTLIQWGSFTRISGSTSSYGSVYILQDSFTFLEEFVDTNYVLTGSGKFGTGAALALGQEKASCSTTTAYYRVWDIAARTLSSSVVLVVTWMAIGRWK